MKANDWARGVVGLSTASLVYGALGYSTNLPPIADYIVAGVVGTLVMGLDLLWIAVRVWFWPPGGGGPAS